MLHCIHDSLVFSGEEWVSIFLWRLQVPGIVLISIFILISRYCVQFRVQRETRACKSLESFITLREGTKHASYTLFLLVIIKQTFNYCPHCILSSLHLFSNSFSWIIIITLYVSFKGTPSASFVSNRLKSLMQITCVLEQVN